MYERMCWRNYVNDDKTVSQLLGTLNRVEAQNTLFVKNSVSGESTGRLTTQQAFLCRLYWLN